MAEISLSPAPYRATSVLEKGPMYKIAPYQLTSEFVREIKHDLDLLSAQVWFASIHLLALRSEKRVDLDRLQTTPPSARLYTGMPLSEEEQYIVKLYASPGYLVHRLQLVDGSQGIVVDKPERVQYYVQQQATSDSGDAIPLDVSWFKKVPEMKNVLYTQQDLRMYAETMHLIERMIALLAVSQS